MESLIGDLVVFTAIYPLEVYLSLPLRSLQMVCRGDLVDTLDRNRSTSECLIK